MPKRKTHYDYDLIIIGSGAGGGVTAHIAANSKKKVAIVEADTLGGECPNFGCVPTKALLHVAEIYYRAKTGEAYGIKPNNLSFDYAKIKQWKELAVYRTGTTDGQGAFEKDGIKIINGKAHFLGPHEISVDAKRYTARKFLIATGTRNFIPPIDGLEESGYITYRDAINLEAPPKSIFIIGGGAIGTEFAQIFSIFGTEVHIAELSPRLLGKEDPEVGGLVGAILKQRFGVKVYGGTKVTKIRKDGDKRIVTFENGGKRHNVKVDGVLLATGKIASVDMGLENAGVKFTQRNIITDETMQTSAKHIYAAGDVAGPFMFTHMASYQSRIAAHNLFHKEKIKANYHSVPRVTFVIPETASVGMTENDALDKGIKINKSAVQTSIIGRANVADDNVGFVKVIATKKGVLIGASIVAPRAG